ncbi:MAG: permease [Desulfuromonadaceae bacterium]
MAARPSHVFWSYVRAQWLLLATLLLYGWAFTAQPQRAAQALAFGISTLFSVVLLILAVMGLVGLTQVWISREQVARLLGHEAGLKALLVAALCGTVLIGPAYLIFPLLMGIRRQGARWAVIGTVLAAYAVKIPMIPLEIEFLGWRFSLFRTLLTILLAIPCGLILETVMQSSFGKNNKAR